MGTWNHMATVGYMLVGVMIGYRLGLCAASGRNMVSEPASHRQEIRKPFFITLLVSHTLMFQAML